MKIIKKLILICAAALLIFAAAACGAETAGSPAAAEPAETEAPAVYESGEGRVIISEVMAKNKATLQDSAGSFPDWIEIRNLTGEDIDLSAWSLDDGSASWSFPEFTLYADSYALVFADKEESGGGELHASFALSQGETVTLRDRNGTAVSSCEIFSDTADCSLIQNGEGLWEETKYPTPLYPNTKESFALLQQSREVSGPLVINEVCVDNFSLYYTNIGYPDWVELKNISESTVSTAGWSLTDKAGEALYTLPDHILYPGETIVILCDKEGLSYQGERPMAPFSLNSENDRLYLYTPQGELADYTPLKDIPYGKSYGRLEGQNGFFYMEQTPEKDNEDGKRFVSESPKLLGEDGIFNGVKTVTLELEGSGELYYTTDGSYPTEQSPRYTGPVEISETCVVRAVCIEEGGAASRPLTLNYIINEEHSIPVVSVVADDTRTFNSMYANGQKELELPGVLSYYGDNGSFTIGAGIKMHGFSTLTGMKKKNMSFRFRGCYGEETLNFDLFGDGGVTEFTNLLLRAGGDQTDTIVKNEVFLNIASGFSDSIVVSRNRYVAVYVNGEYLGIYSFQEKNNEQMYADLIGVDRDSVVMQEDPSYAESEFYEEVVKPVYYEDVKDPLVYEKVCAAIDIDSLIDWTIIEGFSANWDLQTGNLRYVKTEGGKWQLVLYDLDNALGSSEGCFYYVTSYINQVSGLNTMLMKNEDYKDRFLKRAAEAFNGELTAENIWAEFERLAEIIDDEARRDDTISYSSWQNHLDEMKDRLLDIYDWKKTSIKYLGYFCKLTQEELYSYFGNYE